MMADNIWDKFRSLLPKTPLMVGTILSIDQVKHFSRVELNGGAVIIVSGTSVSIGKKAFIRNGSIQSEAPDLPVFKTEV